MATPSESAPNEYLASESDFWDITKTLGPVQLQYLFHNLDIAQHDIEHEEMSANTTDTRLKAMAVLMWWKQTNGIRATRKALFEAKKKISEHDRSDKDSPSLDKFDVTTCQRELRNFYLHTYCKIPRFPGDRHNLNMDDIYTNLSILINLPKPCAPIQIPLRSHHEIFTYKADNGIPASRILALGHPGCGKTSLMLKLAHDWAVKKPDSPLKDIPLLFALNMRWMTPETRLEDAIFHQLLPRDSKLSKSSLQSYIKAHQTDCIVLFDSYDEYGFNKNFQEKVSGVHGILLNDHLRECKVLVTSRFWKASDFGDLHGIYRQMQITGFSEENVREYVMRFFEQDKPSGEKLIEYLKECNLNPGIANIPLMTLLFCHCWKKSGGHNMPSKIGRLYNQVFKLLETQYTARNSDVRIDLLQLTRKLGSVAFSSMFSIGDRLVFDLDEFIDKTSHKIVTCGYKIGLISIENEFVDSFDSIEKSSDFIGQSMSSGSKSSVVFFHKSCQEKCAGEYLAHICEEEPTAFAKSLQEINSVRTCMRLEMIIRFACGASSKAAYLILQQLLRVFRSELSTHIQRYYDETLEPDIVQQLQRFIELCLHCYFERPNSTDNSADTILEELFPLGQMLFIGMSPYTSSAVGLYLSQTRSIKSISVKAITSSSDGIPLGVIDQIYTQMQTTLKSLTPQQLQKKLQLTGASNFLHLCVFELVNYFKEWQPSFDVNLVPIFRSLSSCDQLEILFLINTQIGDLMTTLQSVIERGGIQCLRYLILKNCGLSSEHIDSLLAVIPTQLPNLFEFDLSYNEARLTKLGECLARSQIQRINVSNMKAPVEDMSLLVSKLPQFGPCIKTLVIHDNSIDDNTGKELADILHCASRLGTFSISMDMFQKTTHNKIISEMKHLTHLTTLWIADSPYVDDLLLHMSNTIKYLPQLKDLTLSASQHRVPAGEYTQQSTLTRLMSWLSHSTRQSTSTDNVKRATCKAFIASLDDMDKMGKLRLGNISLHPEDLTELLALCKQRSYKKFRYSKHLFPEDIDDTQYGFLDFA